MILLQVSNFTKSFGGYELFSKLNFHLKDGERVALIGENGSGKSTIIKMILKEEDISSNGASEAPGSIALAKGAQIGYLSQHVIKNTENTLLEEALLVFEEQINLEKELGILEKRITETPHNEALLKQYSDKRMRFERIDGYNFHYQVEMILLKFGFSKNEFDRKISTFSGGERTKMAFAKLLLIKPEILILDEPTNHLDITTIDWLEHYLLSYQGAILFVSHDRYFINAIATRILELENKTLTSYKGNYDEYLVNKKLRYEQELQAYNLQQKEIEKMKRFIEFYKPKPRFVSRAKDREKKLEHMNKLTKPNEPKRGIHFAFQGDSIKDKAMIELKDCLIGYDKALVSPFSMTLFSDDHLAIMGGNGVGKTTLLKAIMGEIKLLSGQIIKHRVLNIGYLRQTDFMLDNLEETVIEYFLKKFAKLGEKDARNHLGKFAFLGDDVFKNISILSGGEKMRLVLAELVLQDYDLLLLDEPTNHLDLLTREALIDALSNYKSAMIVVSHDRYFIDSLSNRVLYFHDGMSFVHDGNYESFKSKEVELFEKQINAKVKKDRNVNESKQKKIDPSKIEKNMERVEGRIKQIEVEEFLEENYMDETKMKVLGEEKAKLLDEYEKLFEELDNITNKNIT